METEIWTRELPDTKRLFYQLDHNVSNRLMMMMMDDDDDDNEDDELL
jgi:hypothetical protein